MKRRIWGKVTGILLCGALLLGAAGCSADPDAGGAPAAKEDGAQAENAGGAAGTQAQDGAGEAAKRQGAPSTGVVLEVATTRTSEQADALQKLMDGFTAQTGIGVEVVAPGDEYEPLLKTRMASNDLPDLFETHGWSTTRYRPSLMALDEQPWVADILDDTRQTVTAADGHIYTLPLSIDPACICYNKEILEQAGVDVSKMRTWADFEAACEKIKALGVTPINGGVSTSTIAANIFEVIAPGFLTNEDAADNQTAALQGGSFDWDKYWTPISELVAGWAEKGYFNPDILTSSEDSSVQALATGEAAFVIRGPQTINEALLYNPDARLGLLPNLTPEAGRKVYVSSGEGTCFGVWKDTEYPEEALQLCEYLAQPENCSKIATIFAQIPAMQGVSNEDAYVTKAYNEMRETFGDDVIFIQYFDRGYLPNGMWNDMSVAATEILLNPQDGVKKSVEILKKGYEDKFGVE